MSDDMKSYLARKSAELGLERADQLAEIQKYLDGIYPGLCRAVSLNEGVLRVKTANASVASELRLGQRELLRNRELKGVDRLIIQIRTN